MIGETTFTWPKPKRELIKRLHSSRPPFEVNAATCTWPKPRSELDLAVSKFLEPFQLAEAMLKAAAFLLAHAQTS